MNLVLFVVAVDPAVVVGNDDYYVMNCDLMDSLSSILEMTVDGCVNYFDLSFYLIFLFVEV